MQVADFPIPGLERKRLTTTGSPSVAVPWHAPTQPSIVSGTAGTAGESPRVDVSDRLPEPAACFNPASRLDGSRRWRRLRQLIFDEAEVVGGMTAVASLDGLLKCDIEFLPVLSFDRIGQFIQMC